MPTLPFKILVGITVFSLSAMAQTKSLDDALKEGDKVLKETDQAIAQVMSSTLMRFASNLPTDNDTPRTFDPTKKTSLTQVTKEILAALPSYTLRDRLYGEALLCHRPIGAFTALSAKELLNLKDACDDNQKTRQALKSFPKILTASEQQSLVNVAPFSIQKTADDLINLDGNKRECPAPELLKLKDELGERNTAGGLDYIFYASIKYQMTYREHQMNLLRQILQGKIFDGKDRVLAWISKSLESGRPLNVKIEEANLKRLYGPNLQLENYVGRLTAKHPACLGVVNTTLIDFARHERTLYRGRYILQQLSKMKVKNPVPKDPFEWVQPLKDDPILDRPMDGWNNLFILESKADILELRSEGPSHTPPGPEIVIGTIPWRQSGSL